MEEQVLTARELCFSASSFTLDSYRKSHFYDPFRRSQGAQFLFSEVFLFSPILKENLLFFTVFINCLKSCFSALKYSVFRSLKDDAILCFKMQVKLRRLRKLVWEE